MSAIINQFLEHYRVDHRGVNYHSLVQISAAFSYLPYENVTKILKETHRGAGKLRQTEEVLQDHLRWRTGGTCFSLCNALLGILQKQGFQAFIGMADMHYGKNIHCAVVVNLFEGRYLLDPGYLLHQPIHLPESHADQVSQTPVNRVVLRREDVDVYSLFTIERNEMKWRYRIRTVAVSEADFRAHWLHSFSLNSMEHLMLTKIDGSNRVYFRKDRLDLVSDSFRKKTIITPDAHGSLAQIFGLPADLIEQAARLVK